MSRFEEIVTEAIDSAVLGETLRAEASPPTSPAPSSSARRDRAEVTMPPAIRDRPAPVSGLPTQEIYTLLAPRSPHTAVPARSPASRRRNDAAPAPGLVSGRARERLVEQGFSDDEIARVFDPSRSPRTTSAASARCASAPRGRRGRRRRPRPLHIVEESMSSEIYELMKRSDEVPWSRRPTAPPTSSRTACARWSAPSPSAPRASRRRLHPRPPGELETIHRHSVVAERSGS